MNSVREDFFSPQFHHERYAAIRASPHAKKK
jgi:hypothetical protein